MRKTQDVILEAVEQIIKDAGLEPTIRHDFANTGTITALSKSDLRTVLSIGFDFQVNYYHLYLYEGQKMRQKERLTLSNIGGRKDNPEILSELRAFVRGLK